jgi:hypothetical protein
MKTTIFIPTMSPVSSPATAVKCLSTKFKSPTTTLKPKTRRSILEVTMSLNEERKDHLKRKIQYAKLREDIGSFKKDSIYIVLESEGPLFWTSSDSREEAFNKLVRRIELSFKGETK